MISTISTPTRTTPSIVREDDTMTHIEDDFLYTAIRNNKFVSLTWNQLTECERRDIYVDQFAIYDYCN